MTPWAPELAVRMRAVGVAACEEPLLPELLGDLTAGYIHFVGNGPR